MNWTGYASCIECRATQRTHTPCRCPFANTETDNALYNYRHTRTDGRIARFDEPGAEPPRNRPTLLL